MVHLMSAIEVVCKEPDAHRSHNPAWGDSEGFLEVLFELSSRIRKGTDNQHKNLFKRSASEMPGLVKENEGTERKMKCKFNELMEPDE